MRVLIINLGGMGAMLMTTTILPKIRRQYPEANIDWLTMPNAASLLENLPELHRVWQYGPETPFVLPLIKYDIAYNVDKDVVSAAVMHCVDAEQKMGFGLDEHGNLSYYNDEARYAFEMGINDELKFRANQRPAIEILAESLGLDTQLDEYRLKLSDEERRFVAQYRSRIGDHVLVGINTGCSERLPNKKLTIEQHIELGHRILRMWPDVKILLLGSSLEKARNCEIAQALSEYIDRVVETPTEEGLRRGICYIDAADIVVSGDTFAMHVAIALRKWVVVWFGLSCIQEIHVYDRGQKLSANVPCSPCWKPECDRDLSCRDQIDLGELVAAVRQGMAWLHNTRNPVLPTLAEIIFKAQP